MLVLQWGFLFIHVQDAERIKRLEGAGNMAVLEFIFRDLFTFLGVAILLHIIFDGIGNVFKKHD